MSVRARRRAIKAGALLLAIWLPLMAVTPLAGASPLRLPSRTAVRTSVLGFMSRLTGEHQAPPKTPHQQRGTAAGKPHQVPAAATRAVARARGHKRGKGRGQVPLYRVHAPKKRRDTTGGAIGVSHFNPRTSTLVDTKSTATSDLYRNTDGTYTRHVYAAPVNYQTSAGTWAPIQTGLVAVSGGGWREAANSVGVSFAARAGSTGLGSLVFGGTSERSFGVGFGLAGAAAVPGTATGPSVTYPAVLPATDLVETTTAVQDQRVAHPAPGAGARQLGIPAAAERADPRVAARRVGRAEGRGGHRGGDDPRRPGYRRLRHHRHHRGGHPGHLPAGDVPGRAGPAGVDPGRLAGQLRPGVPGNGGPVAEHHDHRQHVGDLPQRGRLLR
ncbi:MAG: hypothetical protein M3Z75_01870 [Actinomycetota bacterium]|nr:hypothetical protein [Actinomycetota bacterium]